MDTVPAHYGQQFSTNLKALLQQKVSRLRPTVDVKSGYRGEQVSPVDQLGPVEMKEVEDRDAPKQKSTLPRERRWVAPLDADLTLRIDTFEKLRLLMDPNSEYVQAAHMAAERKFDDRILNGYYASAMTGKTGSTPKAFLAGNVIAVNYGAGANVGMTVPKLLELKRLARVREIDIKADPITVVLTSGEEQDLLKEAQVISLDYNDRPVLVDGELKSFLGFRFEYCERVPVDGDTYRRVPAYCKSGVHLAIWEDIRTSINKRVDIKGEPWEVYVYLVANATRIEEEKCFEIKCA